MYASPFKPRFIHKLLCVTAVLGALSACASAPIVPGAPIAPSPLVAGAPSSHTPQNYETMTSTAAATSTLGGAELQRDFLAANPFHFAAKATTGSFTHNTGRLEIDDGTYLFVDPNGADANQIIINSSLNASGSLRPFLSSSGHVYDYVQVVSLSYPISGHSYTTYGVVGIVTDQTDIPVAGTARYTGDASLSSAPTATALATPKLGIGNAVSTVVADFAAGLVDVSLSNFTNVTENLAAITPAAAAFDQVTGTGLVISGAHFTGGNWVTLKNGAPVNIAPATAIATSDGTFFGYDPSISAPDEVGGVFVIQDTAGYVKGTYVAD